MTDYRQRVTRDKAVVAETSTSAHIEQLRAVKQSVARVAERLPRKARLRFAVGFAITTVEHYWRHIQQHSPSTWPLRAQCTDLDLPPLDESSAWLARTLGHTAAQTDPVTAGYFVGTTYAAALPKELRAQMGVYYTPPALVSRLLDQVTAAGIDWSSCSVLDPACGGGAFLAPVAERMLKELSHLESAAVVAALASRVRGFEIDPVAGWMSQVFLEAMVLPTCRAAGCRLPVVVDVRNSLVGETRESSFDLVIGNPPYGRITLSPRVRARYSESLYGHANLYGLFTDLALRLVKLGGVVAYVTPTSFLAGEYFKNLRAMLGRTVSTLSLDFVAERKGVFDEVLQETLLTTYRRLVGNSGAQDRDSVSVAFVTPLDETVLRITPVGSVVLPSDFSSPWLVPRDVEQYALIERLRRMPSRLSDWDYEVSTGPLVWNRHKDQLREHKGLGCLPLIWAESVRPNGEFVFQATKANHRPYFRPRSADGWLIIRDSCVLVQRTTAKEQARRLIAAVLPGSLIREHGGAVVENHLNMVRPIQSRPQVAPATVAAFLNSRAADCVFRCLSGSVAVSAYELEALPLPSVGDLEELNSAVRQRASRDQLEKVCARLYGLSSDV